MSLESVSHNQQPAELEPATFSMPLSSDELVSAEDVENLHAIISNSHLEEDEEQSLEEALERQLREEFSGAEAEILEDLDAEYLPYKSQGGNTVITFSLWDVFRKGAINLVLPFINGIMLGFGEILAHEIGFHYGFFGARVQPPRRIEERRKQRSL